MHIIKQGNANAEYVLIGICILSICFFSFTQIQKNLTTALVSVKQDMLQRTNSAMAASAATNGAMGPGGGSGSSPTLINPNPYMVGQLDSMVLTTGANGATAQLAQQLQNLAYSLLSSGQITQDEANKLLALANQGLKIANMEKQIENAFNGGTSAGLNSTVTVNGQTVSIQDAGNLIGFNSTDSPVGDLASNPNYMLQTNTASPETLTFINLYNDALSSSGIQNSSQAQAQLQQLSAEISYLSDVTSNLIWQSVLDPTINSDELKQTMISSATTYDSTAICTMGGTCPTTTP